MAALSWLNSKWFNGIELLVIAIIILAHNVFGLFINEVPVLVILCFLSFFLKGKLKISSLENSLPWKNTILISFVAASIRIFGGSFVIEPFFEIFWPPIILPQEINEIQGNIHVALLYLLLVWSFAAFGEEIAYRKYLYGQIDLMFGKHKLTNFLAITISALLFGFGHYYKGPVGIIDSTFAGIILGFLYYKYDKNLWPCILAHGFIDTIGIIQLYFNF